VYTVIGLTRPGDELEVRVYRNPGIVLLHKFIFHRIEDEEERTHIIQKISYEKGAKILEGFVFGQEVKAQRALLTNLKVRLEQS
jgi:ligand-binding SRPBCC domain-containing protein